MPRKSCFGKEYENTTIQNIADSFDGLSRGAISFVVAAL